MSNENENGYHARPHSALTDDEWAIIRKVMAGELTPGAAASFLKRIVGNFELLSTEQLRERCTDLLEMRAQWEI